MGRRRPVLLIVAIAALLVLVAIPVLAASPSPAATDNAAATHEPEATKAPKEPKAQKDKAGDKADEIPVTLKGTISATTDADGETSYTLASGGTTYTLEAGPRWFWGEQHPLKPFAGKSVTITGEQAAGSTEVDVLAVDGTTIREAGKPPWAGGWKVVGKAHPGWSQEKADRFKAKFGDCFPPGQCKDKGPKATEAPAATP
jgi:uncharacterized protein YdeI (BOF family)